MLAEGGEHIGRAARHQDSRRIDFHETHRVAEDVAPCAGAIAQHNRIVDSGLNRGKPVACRRRCGELLNGHELIEHAIIDDHPQPLARTAIGDGDKRLTCSINLAQLRLASLQQLAEPSGIGPEVDPAMHQQFEPRIIV